MTAHEEIFLESTCSPYGHLYPDTSSLQSSHLSYSAALTSLHIYYALKNFNKYSMWYP